ncbi:MAG: biosynthetic-type acetolactate synthase large subunit [Pseudomonadota bacterium]
MKLSGGEIVVESLKREGVEHVFGYPGGSVLHIYDAFFKQDDVQHILVRHEQGATHAADGYARATGKPGVVLVTSGPGVTNTVTGIATANMDSIPMVVLTGQVALPVIGSDAFQECDTIGITRPIVKHNILVKSVEEIGPAIKKAFHLATTGRPGPVVVDIPKNVTDPNVKIDFHYPESIDIRSYRPPERGHMGQIRKAAEMLVEAKRPVIYAGGGVVLGEASDELRQLVRELEYPVTCTLMGLGAYPGDDPLSLGMLGMHGTYEANMSMHEADVILCAGARFDDRVTGDLEKFAPYAKIIHIDVDPSSISKNVKADIPIVGQMKPVLEDMLSCIADIGKNRDTAAMKAWWEQIGQWRSLDSLGYDLGEEIKPQQVIESLYRATKGDAIITSDVGQHQMFAAQYYHFNRPRQWLNSGGLGTMGFGMPAAIGAQLACPDQTVACVTGEASIIMCIQELSTALQYNTPIKIVNLNNRYMGMVRQWQEMFYDKRYSMSYVEALPDLVKMAEAYGHVGIRVEDPAELDAAMEKAFAMKDRLVFIDVVVDQSVNVYPMIANGKGHHEMVLSPRQAEVDHAEERDLA